eukprot:3702086-Pleurochrysis_carterae.AAC.1
MKREDGGELAYRARAKTPPSPACATMSVSCQSSSAATTRSSSLSICRAPGKRACRVDRWTGTHRSGSAQPHTEPRAHGCVVSCPSTRAGTCGTSTSLPSAWRLSAATAASTMCNHPSTCASYTPGRNSWAMTMFPLGRILLDFVSARRASATAGGDADKRNGTQIERCYSASDDRA